jgi:hypothetical protein
MVTPIESIGGLDVSKLREGHAYEVIQRRLDVTCEHLQSAVCNSNYILQILVRLLIMSGSPPPSHCSFCFH